MDEPTTPSPNSSNISSVPSSSSYSKPPISFGKLEEKDYELVPVSTAQMGEVMQYYWHNVPVEFEIFSVEEIKNPVVSYAFNAHCRQLQKRANNPAFIARWENSCTTEEEKAWRKEILVRFKAMSTVTPEYPDVKLLQMWHGTKLAIVGSILETGYANLATTDSGFFGKGIYFTPDYQYSFQVYSQGALIANEVAVFSAYPVIYQDMSMLEGKGNYGNYDAHIIPVVPRTNHPQEKNYDAAKIREKHVYTELVTFQSAACRPRYLVTVRSTLFHTPTASKIIPLEEYQKGLMCKQNGQSQEAIKYFQISAQANFSPAYYELGWCYRKGLGVPKDYDKAVECYQKAADLGLASGHHELGFCYKRGEGLRQDAQKAIEQFQLALDKGYSRAAHTLAACYKYGDGVQKDLGKAINYFKIAADAGMKQAQFDLAQHYQYGQGTEKNIKKAQKYYKLAAAQDHPSASIELANLLRSEQLHNNHHGNNPNVLHASTKSSEVKSNNTNVSKKDNTDNEKNEKSEKEEKCLMM